MTISILGPKAITPELILADCHEIPDKRSLICLGVQQDGEPYCLISNMKLNELCFLEKYFAIEVQKHMVAADRARGRS